MRYFLLTIIPFLLLPSCVRKYGLAEQSFQTKTLTIPYRDAADTTNVSAFYLEGGYEGGIGLLITPLTIFVSSTYDDYYAVHLNAHFAKRYEHIYFGAGITGYKGVIDLQSIDIMEVRGKKDFWGVGATGEVGMSLRTDNILWRPVGLKLSTYVEKGEYEEFRSSVLDTLVRWTNFIEGNANDIVMNISLTTGLSYQLNDVLIDFSMVGGISNESLPFGLNLVMTYKNFGCHLNFTNDIFYGRSGYQAGLQYQF